MVSQPLTPRGARGEEGPERCSHCRVRPRTIRIMEFAVPSVSGSERSTMAVITAACPPAPSDEQLLARLARGEREALEELFRRYRSVAYRVAHRLLGNEADALDAVQEGFAKALTHLPGFQ